MKPNQRWLIIGSLLFATLVAGYVVDDEPVSKEPVRARKAPAMRQAAAKDKPANRHPDVSDTDAERAAVSLTFPAPVAVEAVDESDAVNPFRYKSWYVAPPPPPPAKPTAPPLPFQYLGKVIQDDGVHVFLNYQGKHLIVRAGDVINGIYTVEKIDGSQMTLLYQPLQERQAFAIGSDS